MNQAAKPFPNRAPFVRPPSPGIDTREIIWRVGQALVAIGRPAQPFDYDLRRHIERLDAIRRSRRNTPAQRTEADALLLLIEDELVGRLGEVRT